ncbi:MAG TPA: hypothetical protein VK638_06740 [Edaphobacter sp.]|nr:hypothetical protein [Edaphobacter sp.]
MANVGQHYVNVVLLGEEIVEIMDDSCIPIMGFLPPCLTSTIPSSRRYPIAFTALASKVKTTVP